MISSGKQRPLLQEQMILVLGEKPKHFTTKPQTRVCAEVRQSPRLMIAT
jgi:hypothetical protein